MSVQIIIFIYLLNLFIAVVDVVLYNYLYVV